MGEICGSDGGGGSGGGGTDPPLAITEWVSMITLLTLDIRANTAESLITVVSMFSFASFKAKY